MKYGNLSRIKIEVILDHFFTRTCVDGETFYEAGHV